MHDENLGSQVQLEGFRLDRARRHADQAQDALLSLADIVLHAINSELETEDIVEIRIRPNNSKVIYLTEDGSCGAVYLDPPGICRPCIDGG